MSRTADVIANFVESGDETEVQISLPHLPEFEPVRGWVPTRRLYALRERISVGLEDADKKMGDLRPKSLSDVRNCFFELQTLGEQVAQALVGDKSHNLRRLQAAFKAIRPNAIALPDEIQLIEMRGSHQFLPIQVLPAFGLADVPILNNYQDVRKVAARFLGFGMAVHYELRHSEAVSCSPADILTLQLLHHGALIRTRKWLRTDSVPELPSTAAELAFFRSRAKKMTVEGPWPEDGAGDADHLRQRLVEALFDPRISIVNGTNRPAGALTGVHHFARHCLANTNDSDAEFELVLSAPDGTQTRLSLEQLRSGFARCEDKELPWSGDRPIVVLNACKSANVNFRSTSSFPLWFLYNRHRGVVGTEADVFDDLAAHFTQSFYEALLLGRPLATAVVEARRCILRRHANPMGLNYTYYGSPLIRMDLA